MSTPRTPDHTGNRAPNRIPSAQGSGGHLFTQSQAAKACGVSTSTIRNARDKGRLSYDRAPDGSIRITLTALLAAGFTPTHAGTTHPNTTVTSDDTQPHSAAQDTARADAQSQEATLRDELEKLRQEATEWRVRALVAEAQAHERKEALDFTRLALHALEKSPSAQENSSPSKTATTRQSGSNTQLKNRWSLRSLIPKRETPSQ